ncbi:MAG: biotin/lipoyl-containing protein [Candidatus Muiribacteriota bacterium]
MKYKILVDEKDKFKVEHDENIQLDGVNEIKCNGKKHKVHFVCHDDEKEIKSMFIDNAFYDVEIKRNSSRMPESVVINGQKYSVNILKAGRDRFIIKKDKKEKSGNIKAVIPGKVINIAVKIGDKVSEGDLVLILEAMKMENEITAVKTGTVTQILISEGENVDKDKLMVVIE